MGRKRTDEQLLRDTGVCPTHGDCVGDDGVCSLCAEEEADEAAEKRPAAKHTVSPASGAVLAWLLQGAGRRRYMEATAYTERSLWALKRHGLVTLEERHSIVAADREDRYWVLTDAGYAEARRYVTRTDAARAHYLQGDA